MARFKKGQSGNRAGRPKGIKDRRVKYRELLEPHAQALVKKAVRVLWVLAYPIYSLLL